MHWRRSDIKYRQAINDRKLIFEMSDVPESPGPDPKVDEDLVPVNLYRKELDLPSMPEREVVKHFIGLSQMNFCVDGGFSPGLMHYEVQSKVCGPHILAPRGH